MELRLALVAVLIGLTGCGVGSVRAGFDANDDEAASFRSYRSGQSPPANQSLHLCADTSGVSCPEVVDVFPNVQSITVRGLTYTDTVPATLDLAEWARGYIQGCVNLMLPSEVFTDRIKAGLPTMWVPDGAYSIGVSVAYVSLNRPGDGWKPCPDGVATCIDGSSNPQWAIGLQSLMRAHEMAGSVLSAADAQKELSSLRGVLQQNQNYSNQVNDGKAAPLSYSQGLLNDLNRLFPENTKLAAVAEEYVRYHNDLAVNDGAYSYWFNVVADPTAYNIHFMQVHQQALIGTALSDWYSLSGSPQALGLGSAATDYLLHYGGSEFWANPNPAVYFADPPVMFVGHTLSYSTALQAILADARARYKANPGAPEPRAEVAFVRDGYEFFKRRGGMGFLGNFGVSSTLGVMLELGADLAKFRMIYPDLIPFSAYYEETERWVRNTAAELRFDEAMAAQVVEGDSGDVRYHRVASRGIGTFLSDATHIASIPRFDMLDNNDGLWLMRGLHDVWKSTVEITHGGTVAWINYLLNNASPAMDVYSDLPYRGQVRVRMSHDIGAIGALAVRVPSWAGWDVSVSELDGASAQPLAQGTRWSWNDRYVVIQGIEPGHTYQVAFPMAVQTRTFKQLRTQSNHWAEENYGPDALAPPQGVTTYSGTFLGDTLVSIRGPANDPAWGIPRYQRQNLAQLVSSDSTATEVAPPQRSVTRFVAGLSPAGPVPPRPPPPPPPPVPSFNFSAPVLVGATGNAVYFADMNGDGFADLIQKAPDGTLFAQLNQGSLIFGDPHVFGQTGNEVMFADLNADGFDDLLQLFPDGTIVAQHNVGALQVGAVENLGQTDERVLCADTNGDGWADLIQHARDGSILVQLSQGGAMGQPLYVGATGNQIFFADLNGDGVADLVQVVVDGGTNSYYVQINSGLAFGAQQVLAVTGNTVQIADVNGDGLGDLIQRDGAGQLFVQTRVP